MFIQATFLYPPLVKTDCLLKWQDYCFTGKSGQQWAKISYASLNVSGSQTVYNLLTRIIEENKFQTLNEKNQLHNP